MLLIDPMHNLFLGTAKHFARDLWIGRSTLGTTALAKIKERLRHTVVPTGLGRLLVSIEVGCFLTADQWKNWTIYFLMYCLHDLLPQSQLECWRHCILACSRLCKYSVTDHDITIADTLILRFCKRTVQLYGSEAIASNMHMHCHIASCIGEFGPIHSFWLFPFERYNKILEGQPTNNCSVELQLMRGFQKDNMHLHLNHEAKQWPHANYFLGALPDTPYDISSPVIFSESVDSGPKSVIGSLAADSIACLHELYSNSILIMQPSFQRVKYLYHLLLGNVLTLHGEEKI